MNQDGITLGFHIFSSEGVKISSVVTTDNLNEALVALCSLSGYESFIKGCPERINLSRSHTPSMFPLSYSNVNISLQKEVSKYRKVILFVLKNALFYIDVW